MSPSRNSRATQQAGGTKQVLGMPTAQTGVPSPTRAQFLLHLNTLGSGGASTKGLSAVPHKAWDEPGTGSIQGAQAGDEARGKTRGKEAVRTIHKTEQHNSGKSDCPGLSLSRALGAFGLRGGVSR